MATDKKLVLLSVAAASLGVTTKWLRSEADAGRIPHLKAGDRLLFDLETVERLLLERARGQHFDTIDDLKAATTPAERELALQAERRQRDERLNLERVVAEREGGEA